MQSSRAGRKSVYTNSIGECLAALFDVVGQLQRHGTNTRSTLVPSEYFHYPDTATVEVLASSCINVSIGENPSIWLKEYLQVSEDIRKENKDSYDASRQYNRKWWTSQSFLLHSTTYEKIRELKSCKAPFSRCISIRDQVCDGIRTYLMWCSLIASGVSSDLKMYSPSFHWCLSARSHQFRK